MKTCYCPFSSIESSELYWEFTAPKTSGLMGKNRCWKWQDKSTPSKKTGPSTGHTHGYVYTETTKSKKGDVFTMTTKQSFDFSIEGEIEFWMNWNTIDVTLEVLIWDGFKWNQELFLNQQEKKDQWIYYEVHALKYHNTDSYVRFKITMGDGSYKNDFALDSINIVSNSFQETSDIDTFMEIKNITKLKKGRQKKSKNYMNKNLSSKELETTILDLENKIKNKEIELDSDIVIHESEEISHLIRSD